MLAMKTRATRRKPREGRLERAAVLALVRRMPDTLDVDDLMHRLYLLVKIAASETAAAEGRVIPHDEIVRRVASWSR